MIRAKVTKKKNLGGARFMAGDTVIIAGIRGNDNWATAIDKYGYKCRVSYGSLSRFTDVDFVDQDDLGEHIVDSLVPTIVNTGPVEPDGYCDQGFPSCLLYHGVY